MCNSRSSSITSYWTTSVLPVSIGMISFGSNLLVCLYFNLIASFPFALSSSNWTPTYLKSSMVFRLLFTYCLTYWRAVNLFSACSSINSSSSSSFSFCNCYSFFSNYIRDLINLSGTVRLVISCWSRALKLTLLTWIGPLLNSQGPLLLCKSWFIFFIELNLTVRSSSFSSCTKNLKSSISSLLCC